MASKFYTGQPESLIPNEVKLGGWQLKSSIVVEMSQGLPKVYLRILEEREENFFTYSLCEVDSKDAKHAPKYQQDWAKKLNMILQANIHLFMDDDYLESETDCEVIRKVQAGYKLENV
jgi:hypothetical protein